MNGNGEGQILKVGLGDLNFTQMCQAVTVHAQLPEDVCTQVCMSCVCVYMCVRGRGTCSYRWSFNLHV